MLLYVDGVMDGWEVSHVDIPSKHRERVCGFCTGGSEDPWWRSEFHNAFQKHYSCYDTERTAEIMMFPRRKEKGR